MKTNIFEGVLCGLVATAPMTLFMETAFKYLPWHQRYPLPPRAIMMGAAKSVGIDQFVGAEERPPATLAAHFGYGAAMGGLYHAVVPEAQRGVGTGIAYGVGVWAGSYLGMLPATGLYSPATEHPRERTLLMVAAHVVWGAALGSLSARRQTVATEKSMQQPKGGGRERSIANITVEPSRGTAVSEVPAS